MRALEEQPTGLTRISQTFARAKAQGRSALVTYVMGGDPDLRTSEAMAKACVEAGADLLELGVPFSDPIADGPTLQLAAERALHSGTTVKKCLALAAAVRRGCDVPILLMGYLNPMLSYGLPAFFEGCARSGVDGVILPDLPPEEADEVCALAAQHQLAVVFLLAPTSTPERCEAAFAKASGFLYFVSVTGVTGARVALPQELGATLSALRAKAPVPLVVGFGISSGEQARALGQHADGVVVGSAIVNRIAQGGAAKARAARVRRFVQELRRGLSEA